MKSHKIMKVALIILIVAVCGIASAQDDTFVIGDLILYGDAGFKDEMAQLGYIEGQNITYLYATVDPSIPWGSPEWQAEYDKQAKAMADAGVDVYVTLTDTHATSLQKLIGSDTPIVFAISEDPISTGAVKDLVSPGGNMTGNVLTKPNERRLETIMQIKPETRKVYYLYMPNAVGAEALQEATLQQVKSLAEEFGVELVPAPVTDAASTQAAVENIPEDADWIFMTPYVQLDPDSLNKLTALSQSYGIGIAGTVDMPQQGYVIGYGPDGDMDGRLSAHLVDRILRGASPADLAVQSAENYLAVNLIAAEAIKLEIPVSVLRQAYVIARPGYFDNLDAFGNPITATAEADSGN